MIEAPVVLSIETMATQGNSYIPFANPNVISYLPNAGFHGTDSVVYKIAYQAEPTLFAIAKIYFTVIDNSGIDEILGAGTVSVFPNPAKDKINVTFNAKDQTDLQISLNDLSGKQVLVNKYTLAKGENQLSVDVNGLSKGVYVLNLVTEKGTINYKVVIK
jgi:hypothetical protein